MLTKLTIKSSSPARTSILKNLNSVSMLSSLFTTVRNPLFFCKDPPPPIDTRPEHTVSVNISTSDAGWPRGRVVRRGDSRRG